MKKLKLNLCSTGDPTVPGTWSGTPSKIYSELVHRDQCGIAINAEPARRIKQCLSLLSIPLYGKTDLGRTPIRRYASALHVANKIKKSDSSHTLHTGTFSLPFLIRPQQQHHYLYCDSTWHLWSNNATNMEHYSSRMIRLFDNLETRAYSQMNHIFSISNYVKEDLIEHYRIPPEKITVVGTGLGVIKPFMGEKDYSNRKILFVAKGRFIDKGGELVIAAFKKALKLDPSLKLTIIGSEEAKKFSSHPDITVLGFIPLDDLQELFNTHSIFLMPALNEPWGLVFLEAMACKMPIMGLNRNSFPELSGYGKYGFNIDDTDTKSIAGTLVDAFTNPERLKIMGEQAQTYCINQFSWKKTVDRIIEVIEGDEQ